VIKFFSYVARNALPAIPIKKALMQVHDRPQGSPVLAVDSVSVKRM